MKKIGYIVKHTRNGNGKQYEYFYLRKSYRLKSAGNSKEKSTYLYSFGNRKKALSALYEWEKNIERLPEELKEWGYSLEDVKKWKEEVENK